MASRAARAADNEPTEPFVPEATSAQTVVTVTDHESLQALTTALACDSVLGGAVSILDCTGRATKRTNATVPRWDDRCQLAPDATALVPQPFATMRMLVYDFKTLEEWHNVGLPESFATFAGVRDRVPGVEDAVFDIEFRVPQGDGVVAGVLRVSRRDGSIGVVWSIGKPVTVDDLPFAIDPTPVIHDSVSVAGDCGGTYWPGCCGLEYAFCNLANSLCCTASRCWSCREACLNCSANNPCHACGDCGFAPFGCFLPGGHCGSNGVWNAVRALLVRTFCIAF